MAKKGEITSRTVILWSIAVVVLVVVGFTLFGPQLWGGATKAAFSFGIGALPDQEAPQLEGEVPIPPQLESEFNTLVTNINNLNNPTINSCLVDITDLSGFEDNWYIELSKNTVLNIYQAILYYKTRGGGARDEKKTATLNNFIPCTIKDASNNGLALSFYDCYLKEGNKDCSTFNGITPTMETITLDTNSKYKFLFKKGNSFCTFLFYDDGNSDCDRTPANKIGIDSDCKKKIPSLDANLEVCNQPKALIAKLDTDDSRVQVWDFRLTQNMPNVEENTFMLDNFDHQDAGNECAVLAVEEEDYFDEDFNTQDNAQVLYVKPGSIIENRKIGRLWDGVINSVNQRSGCDETCTSGDFCVSRCGNQFKASLDVSSYTAFPGNGNARTPLGAAWYTGLENDKCGEGRCELLEENNNHKYWKPKNEILCDSTGNWKLCNNALNGQSIIINNVLEGFVFRDISYTCNAATNRWDSNRNKKVVGTRILFVKIDPGDNPIEKWAFYLTDDKELPITDVDLTHRSFDENQDKLALKNLCRVYAVNEEGGLNKKDHLATWYIQPGGRIMTQRDGINNIFGGINGKIHGVFQGTNKRKASPYRTGPDGHSEAVGAARYSSSPNNDNCGNKNHPCNLLKLNPGGHTFIPEHELLCDNDGFWRVCEEYVDGARITADSTPYTCRGEVISNENRWVWR